MTFLGEDVPKLGFGLMRLPHVDDSMEKPIDIEKTKEMVDLFLKSGFYYFDTAYCYPGSEDATREALVERYPRESYLLATKLPAWADAKTTEEAQQMFYTSLERTGAQYFDYYLLHNIEKNRIKSFDNFKIWDFVQELKQKELIKHVGFSFHDHPDFLDEVLTQHPEMEFVQLQINYADWDDPVVEARANLEVAVKHNKPVIIMEPLRGGKLCKLPPAAEKTFKKVAPDSSMASWGIRFARSMPNLITVLSGMSTLEQMQDNIDIVSKNYTAGFSDKEQQAISKVQKILADIPRIPCTDCRYCTKDCPQNIPIPTLFDAYNDYLVYDDLNAAKIGYGFAISNSGNGKGSDCVECGQCEDVCPQSISIVSKLKEVVEKLEG